MEGTNIDEVNFSGLAALKILKSNVELSVKMNTTVTHIVV